ncbi:MAG: hypothetical protein E7319_03155 [Clostridiales bacterium]|nr:hypothetical protein [Clostridiales bacterium]
MFCKNVNRNKWIGWAMVALGIVSFAYGLLTFLIVQPEGQAFNTLLGMFTGFGFGIICVAIFYTIRSKVVPQKKLEQEEIERNDERNIAIVRTACTVGMIAASIVFVVLAFVLMSLGYRVPSFLCIGGLYVTFIATFIARKVLEGKM